MEDFQNLKYASFAELYNLAKKAKVPFSEVIISNQIYSMELTRDVVIGKMKERYDVMKKSIEDGLTKKNELKIEQIGGAKLYNDYAHKSLLGEKFAIVASRAMAVSEVNASMGRICASPTAGSCGIMPASILSIEEWKGISEKETINALFTAAGIGMVISNVMGVSGATAGCQAECGAATAMSAAAIVEMMGGTLDMIFDAVAIALQNIEGLVCDPVASLVECPCIKRNAHGAVSAVLAADMALSGVKSIIPADEALLAMKQVGRMMATELKETSLAGLAATDTAKDLFKQKFA